MRGITTLLQLVSMKPTKNLGLMEKQTKTPSCWEVFFYLHRGKIRNIHRDKEKIIFECLTL